MKVTKKESDEFSNRVTGCAIEVHRHLGPGQKLASNASSSLIFVLFVGFVVHRWLRPLVCHGNMPRVATLTIGL